MQLNLLVYLFSPALLLRILSSAGYPIFGLICLLSSQSAIANHEATEPSDGTVRSFRPVPERHLIPAVTFFDDDGQPVNIQNFRGKVVLVNLWATWCGPCRRELPALNRLQAKFDRKDFVILAISVDKQSREETQRYTQQLALTDLGFYHDSGTQIPRIFPVDVVPANFIIDRNGKAVSFLRSYVDWDDELASAMVQYYIEQSGETPPLWHAP